MPTFKAKSQKINSLSIIKLPQNISNTLPSRGLVLADITIKNKTFQAPLEPDGRGSHWFESKQSGEITITPIKNWPEPEIPKDIKVLKNLSEWQNITTRARWDWIRWIRSTNNPETRKSRIHKAESMLKSDKRNPCCFNRNLCSVPEVSKNGKLLEN